MQTARRPLRRAYLLLGLIVALASPVMGAEKSRVKAEAYVIGEDFIYLLYPGRWFPITNYGIDRFTTAITVTAPNGVMVVGSGPATTKPGTPGKTITSFSWQKPSFPGTVIAGAFTETASTGG